MLVLKYTMKHKQFNLVAVVVSDRLRYVSNIQCDVSHFLFTFSLSRQFEDMSLTCFMPLHMTQDVVILP